MNLITHAFVAQTASSRQQIQQQKQILYARSFFRTPSTSELRYLNSTETERTESYDLPCNPYLEDTGPIELKEAYRNLLLLGGNNDKRTNLIHLGYSYRNIEDMNRRVKLLQRFIDDGWNSFEIRNKEDESSIGYLREATPNSVMDQCVFSTKVNLLERNQHNIYGVREQVTSALLRMGTDSIDVAQLVFSKESPYYMDTLDALYDLKREGLIRCISGNGFPLQNLHRINEEFHLDHLQQIPHNMFSLGHEQREYLSFCKKKNIKYLSAGSFMGGLLSAYYLDRHITFKLFFLQEQRKGSTNKLKHFKGFKSICKSHDNPTKSIAPWVFLQQTLLPVLHQIALKHRVSISTVALRHSMQSSAMNENYCFREQFGGVVVGGDINEEDYSTKQKVLRDSFRFELDEEDLEMLSFLDTFNAHEEEDPVNDELNDNDFFIPNFNDQRLWLGK